MTPNHLSSLPQVDPRALQGFSNHHLGQENKANKADDENYKIPNISKRVRANISKEERQELQELAYTRNETIVGQITDEELDRLLYQAYKLGASEICIQTGQPVRCYVSGIYLKISRRVLTPDDMEIVNKRLYGSENVGTQLSKKCDINVAYSIKLEKLPKDIARYFSKEEKEDIVRYRVNIVGIGLELTDGADISMRIINPDPMTFDQMNVEPEIRQSYTNHIDGLILICGATGNGKTSLLSGFVCDMIYSGLDRKIITYEQPIEIRYDKLLATVDHNVILTQTEISRHLVSFLDGVENSLRRAAHVAIVGESKSYETISASLEFAQTGGLLFTTLHVNNSVGEALQRMVNMFPEEERSIKLFEIVESLRMIVIQRLERSLKGGRVAVREFIEFTPQITNELRNCDSLKEMVRKLKPMVKQHGFSMAQSAQKRYDEGHITKERLTYYLKLDEAV